MTSDSISPQTPPDQPSNAAAELARDTSLSPPTKSSTSWRTKSNKPLWPVVALTMLVVAGFVGVKAYQSLTAAPPKEDVDEQAVDQARLPVRVLSRAISF